MISAAVLRTAKLAILAQASAPNYSSVKAGLTLPLHSRGAVLGIRKHLPSLSFTGHFNRMFAVSATPGDDNLERTEIKFKTQLHGEAADELRKSHPMRLLDPDIVKFGHCPGVHLAFGAVDVANADDVVPNTEEGVQVLIRYPLENPAEVHLEADTDEGVTIGAFARGVHDEYERIYEEEEAEPGRYGIYGHDIFDLYLMSAYRVAGSKVWKLRVDS